MKNILSQLKSLNKDPNKSLDLYLSILGFFFAFFSYAFLIKEFNSPVLDGLLKTIFRTPIIILFKSSYSLIGLFLCLLTSFVLSKKNEGLLTGELVTEYRIKNITQFSKGCILYLVIIPLTTLTSLKFSFITDASQGYLYLLLICLLTALHRKKVELLIFVSILLCPVLIYFLFLIKTNNLSLFTDDHGSVIYRLALLKENFPAIPVYNTEWNAGMDWRDFFATGILNVFTIFSPILYTFDTLIAYKYIPSVLLLIILPLALYYSTFILTKDKNTGIIAGGLGICSSSIWYRWGLSYGSLGFVCSACLFSLSVILLLKCLKDKNNCSWYQILLTNIIATLSVQWSALMLALIPVILIYLYSIKSVYQSKKLLFLVLSLVAINLPWIISFIHVSNVLSFVETNESSNKRMDVTKISIKENNSSQENLQTKENISNKSIIKEELKKIASRTREFSSKVNPLIFLLLFPSLFLLLFKQKNYFYDFTIIYAWLILLGTLGPSFKPQLELERMLVLLAIFSSIPVSILLKTIISKLLNNNFSSRLIVSTLAAWIILSFIVIGSIFQNKAWDKFVTWPNNAEIFKQRVLANYKSGRLLFAGFVLHDFEGGHIAYLTKTLNIPIVASSPVHNLWQYKDIMPGSFYEAGVTGVEKFLEIYNASIIAAHEKNWKDFYRSYPNYYEETGRAGKFAIFKRINFVDNYFLNGAGEIINQNSSGLTLKVNSKDADIKFRYYNFLEVSGCESILPYSVEGMPDIVFTSLKNCQSDAIIKIKSKSIFKRVLGL